MAAYASLVSLSQTIQRIPQQHVDDDQICSVFLRYFNDHVVFLQSFLEEKISNDLEGRIRDIANVTEDIIEYFILNQIQPFDLPHIIAGLRNVKFFRFISGRITSYIFHSRPRGAVLCKELEKVRHELDSIVGEVMVIKNCSTSGDVETITDFPSASSLSGQVPEKDIMVGFDEDLNKIKARLCGESSKLEVIPIVGMGGIGKTTLAMNAYRDKLIVEQFYIRAWVTVSQHYSVKRIVSELIVSMGNLDEEESDRNNERLYQRLKGRRYLAVIDDMWSTGVWDDLRRILPDDDNGSRIILTTRLSDVAGYACDSSQLHEMQLMDVDQSWHLLRQNVFKQEQCPHELKDIGRKIARSCSGLPLAISVIAGVLKTETQTRASWENVAKNVNLAVTTNEEQFANILSLSYTHLPHHLRLCFLYMGGFPEDYEIPVTKLIKLWTAEGFIKSAGSKNYEESAEEYLEGLVKRSLILVSRRKWNRKIKSCNIHDLLRDLCIRKAEEEKFLLNLLARDVNETHDQRRVSTHHNKELRYYECTIRTILWFQFNEMSRTSCHWLKDFRLLRVLDVSLFIKRTKFPTELLELIFLRYLALLSEISLSEFEIPASISRLQNLETLIIRSLILSVKVPLEIWGMTQLRHLVLSTLCTLPNPCSRNSILENLQTLTQVKNFICTEGISQMIPNLKKLEIMYDAGEKFIRFWPEHHLKNLVHLQRLEKLKIFVLDGNETDVVFWENIAFPGVLKKLTLIGLRLSLLGMEMIGSLPNLQVLKLESCRFEDSKWKTNEGQFRQLKFLEIVDTNVQQWIITENSHFPMLEHLTLCLCRHLGEIPDVIGEIPTLELIEVYEKDINVVESAKRMQEEQQESYGNYTLQLRILKTLPDSSMLKRDRNVR